MTEEPKETAPRPEPVESAEDQAYAKQVEAVRGRWYATAGPRNMTFKRMLPWVKSPFEKFIKELSEYDHNYDTICHAVACAGIAAMWAMNRTKSGGITWFQANQVMWMVIRHWGRFEKQPMKLTDFSDFLYPQAKERLEPTMPPETWAWIQEAAKTLLEESKDAHPEVIAHWERIVAGEVPFGFSVKEAA